MNNPVPRARIPNFDELRGLAVIIVLVIHILYPLDLHRPFAPTVDVPSGGGAGFWLHKSDVALQVTPLSSQNYGKSFRLTGLVFKHSPAQGTGVSSIDVQVRGKLVGRAQQGIRRPEWKAGLGDGLSDSGWLIDVPIKLTKAGENNFKFIVTTEDGKVIEFKSRFQCLGRPHRWPFEANWLLIAGQMSMDLFFIFSGFLITLIVGKTIDRPKFLSRFYGRRAVRILPLAILLVGLAWFVAPNHRHLTPGYLFFYSNYQAGWGLGTNPLLHPMWSLALEEQFYILLPLAAVFIGMRYLWIPTLAATLTFMAFSAFKPLLIDGLYTTSITTHTRGWSVGCGVLVALCHLGMAAPLTNFLRARKFWIWAAVIAVWIWGGTTARIGWAMIPFVAAMMWVAVQSARQKVFLSSRVLSWIGLRCFGFYLLHEWVIHFLPLAKSPWLSIGIYLVVTPIVAALSFRWFESPFLRLVKSSESTSIRRDVMPDTFGKTIEDSKP